MEALPKGEKARPGCLGVCGDESVLDPIGRRPRGWYAGIMGHPQTGRYLAWGPAVLGRT